MGAEHVSVTALLERDELLAALASAASDGGRLVFVGGEAGAGKTALVRAFALQSGRPLLRGSCESLATPTPLGPFVDIAAVAGGALATVLAETPEPRVIAHALLAELSRPVVVVFEDVHWADEATLDALRVLGRRIEGTRGLVIATYRDDEVESEHPLRTVLGELASAPGVSRLTVPPLSVEAVRRLAVPQGADGDAIHALTAGNAFFVTEVLALGPATLPETARDAVLARTAPLGATARRLLDVVALVPGRTELPLLEAVAAVEVEELDACLAAGVLREEGGAVAFRHEIARLALESAVPAGRRRDLHARILRALREEPGGGDPARLAHHAERAGDAAAVLECAPEAGRRAAASAAHREAAQQYARALRFAGGLSQPERAGLLDRYALEAQLTGRYADAAEAWREAAELHGRVGDRVAQGRSLSALTRACIPIGRNADAEAASRSAIDVLESLAPGPELAEAYAHQAYVRLLVRDTAEGVAWGKRAAALSEQFDDFETLGWSLSLIGASYTTGGEIDTGIEYLRRGLTIAREHGWIWVGPSLQNLGSSLGEMYELDRSERYLREHIAWADEHDLWPYYSSSWLALVECYTGRWDDATATAQDVLAKAKANDSISRINALIALGRVRARRGDPGSGEILDEALALALPGGHLQRLGHVRAARAEAAWLAGDPARASEEALAAYPLALEKRHPWFAGELAYWLRRADALDAWPVWIAEPYRLELEGSHEEAAAAWRRRGCPYEAARALGESRLEAPLRTALQELETLGAAPGAQDVRQQLRRLGAAVPRGRRSSTRTNPAGLTAREVDVLRLVVAGKRNAEIANELVLSTRTVDHHVSAILRKLRARTRGEAAVVAVEGGLLDD
jgi:DNA-binding CsgD family transcriptional regulator/tetratricopeptide (TPR) repeat protein